jgi:SAM-dependent methyltransferase
MLIYHRDVANEYPAARIVGVDLSPIQPARVPPNCQFEIDNVTLPWTYDSEQFDLIYIREMFGSIPDWDMFFRQCWNSLRPGGYVEVVEHSVTPILDDGTLSCLHGGHGVIHIALPFQVFGVEDNERDLLKPAIEKHLIFSGPSRSLPLRLNVLFLLHHLLPWRIIVRASGMVTSTPSLTLT